VYKQTALAFLGIQGEDVLKPSTPFEVLTCMVCVGVLASSEQGIFGVKALVKLQAMQVGCLTSLMQTFQGYADSEFTMCRIYFKACKDARTSKGSEGTGR
jgi:hypothetical protein